MRECARISEPRKGKDNSAFSGIYGNVPVYLSRGKRNDNSAFSGMYGNVPVYLSRVKVKIIQRSRAYITGVRRQGSKAG